MSVDITNPEPLLRTLAPALRRLHADLVAWLEAPRRAPPQTMTRAALEGMAEDLGRQAAELDVGRPLLVVLLMGGTGVGKSTLLNALAGGPVAQASFARPTTRDPVVYLHESADPDRLAPALRACRIVTHDRRGLEQKVVVDTPDLDSNDLANRDKLAALLPVADVVLYVGSQEKYHDRLGWDLFRAQRRRRAFAFVLNKWDRCLHAGASGLRPDEDLLRDLEGEGFRNPLLFRTCARHWVEQRSEARGQRPENLSGGREPSVPNSREPRAERREPENSEWTSSDFLSGGRQPPEEEQSKAKAPESKVAETDGVPEGEQFPDLVQWLEAGLTRLEIEAIKARGVGQLLHELGRTLDEARPPDVGDAARRTQAAWNGLIAAEADASAGVLLNTLEPYRREIEHHFSLEGQKRFHGLMATYLNLFSRARYAGSSLRGRIPFLPRVGGVETPAAWDLAEFTAACSRAAGEQHLDARVRALGNRLLVEADRERFPVALLAGPVESVGKMNWQQRYAQVLVEALDEVERHWTQPAGVRRLAQSAVIFLANYLPPVALLGSAVLLLWQYFVDRKTPALGDILVPVIVVVVVLVLLHAVISLVLPMRWPAVRGDFQRQLERRLKHELAEAYLPIPVETAEALDAEGRSAERLAGEVREVGEWLARREQAAHIAGLYGSED